MYRISVCFCLLTLEMWHTYQQYLVAQKTLAVVVVPLMLNSILPLSYDYSHFPVIAIFLHVINALLLVWNLVMPFLGIYGARREKPSWLCMAIYGLAMQICLCIVQMIFGAKVVRGYGIYMSCCKSFYTNSIVTCIILSVVALVYAYLCLRNFRKGLLFYRKSLYITVDTNNCTAPRYTGSIYRSRLELDYDEIEQPKAIKYLYDLYLILFAVSLRLYALF